MSMSKDARKALRACLQIVFLLAAAGFAARQFMERGDPPVFDRQAWTQRDGFTAISYGSLTREERPGQNSRGQFARHLKALKAAGYNWITTGDIVDFYEKGRPLPEKALYLMLEGGRKDNVIFGQNIIGPAGAHAALFTYTDTLSSWNNFFVTFSNVASISKSPFWDVGSQGPRLMRVNENMPGVEPGYFLSDFLRDENGKKAETGRQAFERLAEYYQKSYEPLASSMAAPPLAYILMPANCFGAYMPAELEEANKSLMERYFRAAFTREGPAFNSAADDAFNLSRMQVKAHWDERQLLDALEKWRFNRKKFTVSSPDSAGEWNAFRTRVEVEGEDLLLLPEDGFADPALLRGTALWENVNLSVTFRQRDKGERYIYLRYSSRESYLRLTLRSNRLLAHERLPGVGLVTIYDSVLPVREPWNFDIQLKGGRLRVNLNGSLLRPGLLPVSEALRRGHVALGASPMAGRRAVFSGVEAESPPTVWRIDEPGAAPPPEDLYRGLITARVLPLPQDRAGREEVARRLLQTGGEGNMAVAALPPGRIDFDPEELVIPPFDREHSSRLWSGVAIQPDADADWEEARRAVARINENGCYAVVRLSLAAALALAASGTALDADYLLLDFEREDMPAKDWIALAHRHNRNNFLHLSPEAGGAAIYAARSE